MGHPGAVTMGLVLRVEGTGEPPGLFEAGGGVTIGRGVENDLVLPDESRTISKCHCELALLDGSFRLIDHSRNGTFLNGAAEPVGPAAPVPVGPGDVIRLGQVTITVVATGAELAPPPAPPDGWDEAPEPLALAEPEEPSALFPPARPATLPPVEPAAFADHVPAEVGLFVQPRVMGEAIPDDWDLVGELRAWSPPPAPEEAEAPAPPDPAPVPAPQPAREPGQEQAAVAAFLAACGLEPRQVTDPAALMARAGRLLACMVAEMHALMAIRSLAKQEFGLERTMIGRSDNNPLKFAAEPREALPLLLAPDAPGFLDGEDAVRQGFEGIRSHQLALLSSMQTALGSLCDRLAPEAIVASPPLWARPLPFARDAARWAAYQQVYQQVVSGLDGDMLALLGTDPVRAPGDAAAGNSPSREGSGHAG
ncbi:type VI secretion system-associated FHA domain protein TagH [Roseomonas marmotae]|uniref:Type VI secretion system-associated FHA domain protein TagH n=1 Tax=Roseomonas marmotae TaxID=2768161 RepID=A0ABS3K9J6_9PROT|nr:type VI secretion system-associated FHA domain protein TagH [Roseomonas marmotae]MBO1073697.1 type VI secretion system-associated FHA domain protein TagH [Roseomonas marmotae]QTI78662.1 type VI secretion system-associated FHA domain protein TagH [Roseomonas marmotae]